MPFDHSSRAKLGRGMSAPYLLPMASAEPRTAASAPTERASSDRMTGAAARPDAHEAARLLTPQTRRDFALVVPALNEAPMATELVAELKRAWSEYGLE